MEAHSVENLSKQEIIERCCELIGRGWQGKLAKRSGLVAATVSRWVDDPDRKSFQLEHFAKIMIKEELKIKALFPDRV